MSARKPERERERERTRERESVILPERVDSFTSSVNLPSRIGELEQLLLCLITLLHSDFNCLENSANDFPHSAGARPLWLLIFHA